MQHPHFLSSRFGASEISRTQIVLLSIIAACWVGLFIVFPAVAIMLLLGAALLLLSVSLERGFLLFLPFVFLHGLELDFSTYSWARNIPYLAQINAPLIDFLMVFLFVSFRAPSSTDIGCLEPPTYLAS